MAGEDGGGDDARGAEGGTGEGKRRKRGAGEGRRRREEGGARAKESTREERRQEDGGAMAGAPGGTKEEAAVCAPWLGRWSRGDGGATGGWCDRRGAATGRRMSRRDAGMLSARQMHLDCNACALAREMRGMGGVPMSATLKDSD